MSHYNIKPFLIGTIIFHFFILFGYAQTFTKTSNRFGGAEFEDNVGVSVADYDNDNDLDLFVVSSSLDEDGKPFTHSRLFKNNNNGTFSDVTLEARLNNLYSEAIGEVNQIPAYIGYKFGASWGDFNNDGYPDLFLTNAYKVQLYKNNGDGTFANVTTSAGFPSIDNCANTTATWFDYNNDGFLDIYIADFKSGCGNRLYKNLGNETFAETTENVNLHNEDKNSFMAIPIDVNKDGYMDLYVTNDFSQGNDLYINYNGSWFIESSSSYGLDINIDAMGIAVGDYNLDNILDFYITDTVTNTIVEGNSDNTFQYFGTSNIYLPTDWAWDTRFADLDNDGDDDLLVCTGETILGEKVNVIYKNLYANGVNSFENITAASGIGIEKTVSYSSEVFDYDNDGDLDIFFSNSYFNTPSSFYDNKLINGFQETNLNWIKIKLKGVSSNRDGIGTKLKITTTNGSFIKYYSGMGLYSQSLQSIHFGLGETEQVTSLSIEWPSGIIDNYSNINANSHIQVTEGVDYQYLGITPSIKTIGCTDPNSCNYNPLATLEDGSCSYLESKLITGSDTSYFLSEENYTYPLGSNSTIVWQAEGGHILEGQGTNTVKIKWNVASTGKVIATETDGCSTLPIELNVSLSSANVSVNGNASVARLWNEVLLEAIRNDYARPTVHARNLFHASIAMYDSWSVYDTSGRSKTYMLGNQLGNYTTSFAGFTNTGNLDENRLKTLSYAMYRLLKHRFENSPGADESFILFDLLMDEMGYDKAYTSTDYSTNDAAALGNYIASNLINFGYVDGSRETTGYDNAYYAPVNQPLPTDLPGNTTITDPNRWQPLSLETFIDQSGNLIPGSTPDFLSPEWGNVVPFSLQNSDKSVFSRSGSSYNVYHNPGTPPLLDINTETVSGNNYKWGFSLVSIWGSHLDPTDGVMVDISPKSLGNIAISQLPTNVNDYPDFYNTFNGGDIGSGYAINPHTNAPYTEQLVPRGDYGRVLAEFWADGPDSETPPGHWFTLLNYVSDHELLVKKFEGEGEVLSNLEWDIKSYFTLGGAMHDAAIAAWGIKGWYDYLRPISAIRYMAEMGQSTNNALSNFNVAGIPLEDGFVEMVETGDPLAGNNNEHVGKIKLFTWKGHSFIADPSTDIAGVGWILAENWMPYQRPSFVTPPFAGYVSGHSTYSRAAAEVLTRITGDAYFPGGMGEFVAKKDEFLVFENGPSQDVTLQWATYRDASDQCSLSRIWGGIHPPADDIPGRIIGEQIGLDAFDYAKGYFDHTLSTNNYNVIKRNVFPNPVIEDFIRISNTLETDKFSLVDVNGKSIKIPLKEYNSSNKITEMHIPKSLSKGIYFLSVNKEKYKIILL
ncbi:FG-GAP-like repeat-containing protein [Sabulilitoribacter arenilitoris]|uniref:FG-GAP-like repeat-containing protein n=1 Tax=Wocania arenilitoris TaxID=2044858 RepID=A0AAE3ENQ8_9FLAO|nr:FG-GAP-like repeat-containing protein [Wocania arenilitoris]MCF7568286.1 FG-GAP-like repeat-containing protein [Wocania arenilitoris]